jgi:hypothetical protein
MFQPEEIDTNTDQIAFEAHQNALGFFDLLLEITLKHPDLREKVFAEPEAKGTKNSTHQNA